MNELEGPRPLDPRAKILWRLRNLFGVAALLPVLFGVVVAADVLLHPATNGSWGAETKFGIVGACALVLGGVWIGYLPKIRHRTWRYEVNADFLSLRRGVFTVRRTIVPLVRVQNVDTVQGPLMRGLGLSAVVIYTAANNHTIPALSDDDAHRLREAIGEYARLARDEVE